jgi:hypothetical protein
MASRQERGFLSIIAALSWATLGGALIGSVSLTAPFMIESAQGQENALVQALLIPLGLASVSLIIALPATVLFGIPTALLVERKAPSRWAALAICLAGAGMALVATHWLVLSNDYTSPFDMLYTAPFALGAAFILWWRLTRTA